MNTNSGYNRKSHLLKFGVFLICIALCFGCEERKVGTAVKSTAKGPGETEIKATSKSEGGQFRTSVISSSAFTITPKSGFKINLEYPWKMSALSPGVNVGEIKLDEETATIGIELPKETLEQKKDFKIKGSFSVCNDEKCLIYRDEEIKLSPIANLKSSQ